MAAIERKVRKSAARDTVSDDGHRVGPRWLGLYANSADRRLWVPRTCRGLGWTINLGHPAARWIIAASAGALIFGLALAYASASWT